MFLSPLLNILLFIPKLIEANDFFHLIFIYRRHVKLRHIILLVKGIEVENLKVNNDDNTNLRYFVSVRIWVRRWSDGVALERDLHHLHLLRLTPHCHLHNPLRRPLHPQLSHLPLRQEEERCSG